MKSTVIAIVAATVTCVVVIQFSKQTESPNLLEAGKPVMLSATDELANDVWIGFPSFQSVQAGSAATSQPDPGPAEISNLLSDSSNSVCFLTKVEMALMDGPEDQTSCRILIDEFTNWWELHAAQGAGTNSAVSCNARCLVWE